MIAIGGPTDMGWGSYIVKKIAINCYYYYFVIGVAESLWEANTSGENIARGSQLPTLYRAA